MALVKAESVQGFQRLPALRQIGLMAGLAASVALGVAIVLWSQTPRYTLLYGNLSSRDAGEVTEALQKSGIDFKVEDANGAIMVPSASLHNARMQLAKEGLPQGNSTGFEMLQQEQGFGTSQFIETARYQRALEGELARTIGTLRNVESARVHLAIPKRSVFLRDRSKPTASVMVDLYSGRSMEEGQVAAIVHLVSSSVPHLEAGSVTVVDQRGNLLSNGVKTDDAGPSTSQFSYNRKLEQAYIERIRELLEPIVGAGRVRATVAADLDFTVTERTEESYNPDLPALRSEQTREESSAAGAGPSGVPGALSNQPPETGQLQDTPGVEADATADAQPRNSSKQSVRNYELDKTISHTKLASGTVRRLSIAVVIDDKQTADKRGKVTTAPWPDEELQRFTGLIKEAVGFNVQRGDTLNVINSSFAPPPKLDPVPEPSLFEQAWLWDLLKQVGGVLGVLILVFGLLRPVLRSLAERGAESMQQEALLAGAGAPGQPGLPGGAAGQGQLQPPQVDYETNLRNARAVVKEDPRRVAQVVKNWVAEDG
jgi:flagellar M-ring protein FliF